MLVVDFDDAVFLELERELWSYGAMELWIYGAVEPLSYGAVEF